MESLLKVLLLSFLNNGTRKLLLAVGVGDVVEMLALIPGNMEPSHNTKDTLPQLNSEVVNPTSFADHQD